MDPVRGARAAARGDNRLSEPREPLWAGGLAAQPRPADDDFFEAPPPAPVEAVPPGASPALLGLAATAVLAVLWGLVLTGGSAYTRRVVLSAWGAIPMTCDTTRFDRGDGAAELFTCRAFAGGRLPPGLYRSPRAQWRSDLMGQEARGNVIRITPDGALSGVAIY